MQISEISINIDILKHSQPEVFQGILMSPAETGRHKMCDAHTDC